MKYLAKYLAGIYANQSSSDNTPAQIAMMRNRVITPFI